MVKQLGWPDFFYETEIIEFTAYLAAARLMREIASKTKYFAAVYPLASFICYLLAMMSPALFMNLCIDEPILNTVTSPKIWLYSFICYVLCFFSPRDMVWNMLTSKFGLILVDVIKDVHRVLVAIDVTNIVSSRPHQMYFGPFVAATVKNCISVQVLYVLEQLIRGDTIKKHDLKTPSFSLRLSVFCAIVCNLVRYFKRNPIDTLTFTMLSQLSAPELMLRFATVVVAMRIAHHFGYDILAPKINSISSVKEVYESITEKVASVRSSSVTGSRSQSIYGRLNSSRNSSFEDSVIASPTRSSKRAAPAAGGRSTGRAVTTQKRTTGRAK